MKLLACRILVPDPVKLKFLLQSTKWRMLLYHKFSFLRVQKFRTEEIQPHQKKSKKKKKRYKKRARDRRRASILERAEDDYTLREQPKVKIRVLHYCFFF
jgi:hypothetical protein